MHWIANLGLLVLTFIAMEGAAWATHKYVMHGFLWVLHKDHHQKGESWWERNDLFFVIFAVPGSGFSIWGALTEYSWPFWIGLGITLYGICYFLVHDIFIHQRFRWLRRTDSAYFRAIRKAHKVHHKHRGPERGECFGMLWVPTRYFKEARVATRNQ